MILWHYIFHYDKIISIIVLQFQDHYFSLFHYHQKNCYVTYDKTIILIIFFAINYVTSYNYNIIIFIISFNYYDKNYFILLFFIIFTSKNYIRYCHYDFNFFFQWLV